GEVGRTLLDLTSATRADRLRNGRDLLARSGEMLAALRASAGGGATGAEGIRPGRGRRSASRATVPSAGGADGAEGAAADAAHASGAQAPADESVTSGPAVRVPAAERRAAALALVAL